MPYHDVQHGPFSRTRHRREMPQYSRVATGDILPSRFVSVDVTHRGHVQQSVAADDHLLYGVSQRELRGAPYNPSLAKVETRAAADGESLFVYGADAVDVPLTYGAAVQTGDRLTSDDNGAAVKAQVGDWCLAVAQQSGITGDVKKVTLVLLHRVKG